jgi:hypothetical protein
MDCSEFEYVEKCKSLKIQINIFKFKIILSDTLFL